MTKGLRLVVLSIYVQNVVRSKLQLRKACLNPVAVSKFFPKHTVGGSSRWIELLFNYPFKAYWLRDAPTV